MFNGVTLLGGRQVDGTRRLRTFDRLAQDYGIFVGGYSWDIYGCGTFRGRKSIDSGTRLTYTFFDRLTKSLKAPVAWFAVPERRTSGLGFPGIALHWHFVAAAPRQHRRDILRNASSLWRRYNGDACIRRYDSNNDGAFYLTKLASGSDFDYHVGNLDRMSYTGPTDLFAHYQSDPYVPEHARHMTTGQTLVVRNF
jgi:hypothetical protein